jgi:hypothetical protein
MAGSRADYNTMKFERNYWMHCYPSHFFKFNRRPIKQDPFGNPKMANELI